MFLVGFCNISSNESIGTSQIPSIGYFGLSRIIQVKMPFDDQVTNKFLHLLSSTYKSYSFGSRDRSSCLGMNIYSGTRGTKRIRPSPRMCVSTRMKFQYTNAMWNMSLMPLVQKTINVLTKHAVGFFLNESI